MILIPSLLLSLALAGTPGDTVTVMDIQREYDALVYVVTVPGPNAGAIVRIVAIVPDSVPKSSVLYSFVHAHEQLIWYLASHTPGAESRILDDSSTSSGARAASVNALRQSAVFNERLFTMLARFWKPRGRVIANYSSSLTIKPLSAATLARIGARFFYPDRFSPVGDTMFTHICAGLNGLSDLPEAVDPLVEAFVFLAISNNVFRPNSPLMRDYETAAGHAKLTSASKDPLTRIRRAQGAMWAQLEGSAALKKALATEFKKNADVLPLRVDTF